MSTDMRADRAATFLALHERGFVLPNVWDAGGARILASIGFPAIATTSAGIAWAAGVRDGGLIDRDEMLAHVAAIVAAVDVPVTADLEAGYGDQPEDVAETVARAVAIGVVGANIEDAADGRLFDIDVATDRIAAARSAAPRGTFVLNARTDAYFVGTSGDPFDETLVRAGRYLEAGADCIFVPGVRDVETIHRLTAAIAAPVNIVAGLTMPVLDVATLLSLGVARVCVGGSLARIAFSALARAGRELLESGTLSALDSARGYADLQRLFSAEL